MPAGYPEAVPHPSSHIRRSPFTTHVRPAALSCRTPSHRIGGYMNRRQSGLLWAGLLALVFFTGAGSAQAQPACEDVCRYGVSCDTRCTMPNPAPGWEPTCGDAGFTCGCDAWFEVDRRPIGLLV